VTAQDALAQLRYLEDVDGQLPDCAVVSSQPDLPVGDVNCDGAVTMADVMAILSYVGGIGPAPGSCAQARLAALSFDCAI
jgi:hypothetical protein